MQRLVGEPLSGYLWKEATGSKTVGEIIHADTHGSTQLLVHEGALCFGNRHIIDKYLATSGYAALMPLIPQEELFASSVVHPADASMQWLLNSQRVPLLAASAAQPSPEQIPVLHAAPRNPGAASRIAAHLTCNQS